MTILRIKKSAILAPILGWVFGLGILAQPSRAEQIPSEIIATGTGWRLVDVEPETAPVNSVLWEVKRSAIESLPVSESQKQIIRDTFSEIPVSSERGSEEVVYFSQEMLQAMEDPSFPAGYEQFVEPDDPKEIESLSFCSWKTETRNRSWTYSRSLLDFNVPFTGSVTGGISGSFPLSGTVNLSATYKIRKCLGVPVGFRFVSATASGSATIAGNADLDANAQWADDWAKEWHLITIDLGEVSFMAGPIPVRLVFTLPIHYGVQFEVEAVGQVSAHLDASATGTFNYTCTPSSCSGSSNFSDQFNFEDPTASVEVDLTAEAYVRALVRVAVYDESFLYVEGGAKAYAKAAIWGYLGNACGDADGNGQNETVRALVADLLWGYKFAYGWGGIINDTLRYTGGSEYLLEWRDLLGPGGSTALQPMVHGPSSVTQNATATYTVKMRPCYPYSHTVTVSASPAAFSGAAPFAPSGGSTTITGSFANTGNQALTVTAVSDSFGRDLGTLYARTINVTPMAPTWPGSLTATATATPGAVSLGWVDRSNNETSFEIQRRLPGGSWAQIATPGANATSYLDSTVAAGTTYEYRIRARNSGGNSAWSNVAAVTTSLGLPAAPTNLTASFNATQGLVVTWTDNASNETGFTLEFSYSGSAFSPVSGTFGPNATSWVSGPNVPPGGPYQFRVRANNANGSSAWSNVASVVAF